MSKGKMGFWTIVLFGINSIIGSGIFLLPNNAMSIIVQKPILPLLIVTSPLF